MYLSDDISSDLRGDAPQLFYASGRGGYRSCRGGHGGSGLVMDGGESSRGLRRGSERVKNF